MNNLSRLIDGKRIVLCNIQVKCLHVRIAFRNQSWNGNGKIYFVFRMNVTCTMRHDQFPITASANQSNCGMPLHGAPTQTTNTGTSKYQDVLIRFGGSERACALPSRISQQLWIICLQILINASIKINSLLNDIRHISILYNIVCNWGPKDYPE